MKRWRVSSEGISSRRDSDFGVRQSYHAGLVARHWIESLAGLPCQVEVASGVSRFGDVTHHIGCGHLPIGRDADTLCAGARQFGAGSHGWPFVCGPQRNGQASELVYLTSRAEIGVASTKAFNATGCAPQSHTLSRSSSCPNAVPESVKRRWKKWLPKRRQWSGMTNGFRRSRITSQTNVTHCFWEEAFITP